MLYECMVWAPVAGAEMARHIFLFILATGMVFGQVWPGGQL